MEKKLPRIKALLTPGEVAKRSGVAVSALHFYESKGLITSIRNSGNQRRYCCDMSQLSKLLSVLAFRSQPFVKRLACCQKGIR